jgi:uncharacterized membrane protein YqjE
MAESKASFSQLAATAKEFARRLLTIGENRLELLALEVQKDRGRLLNAFLLALGVAAFGLLASIPLTEAIVASLWAYSPVAILLTLTSLCSAAGVWPWQRLTGLLRDRQTFPATLGQLQKDRICLDESLA